jgi:hypothetical protein
VSAAPPRRLATVGGAHPGHPGRRRGVAVPADEVLEATPAARPLAALDDDRDVAGEVRRLEGLRLREELVAVHLGAAAGEASGKGRGEGGPRPPPRPRLQPSG